LIVVSDTVVFAYGLQETVHLAETFTLATEFATSQKLTMCLQNRRL
jgi:hypothetical protein